MYPTDETPILLDMLIVLLAFAISAASVLWLLSRIIVWSFAW